MTLYALSAGPLFAANLFVHSLIQEIALSPSEARAAGGYSSTRPHACATALSRTSDARALEEDAERWDGLS